MVMRHPCYTLPILDLVACAGMGMSSFACLLSHEALLLKQKMLLEVNVRYLNQPVRARKNLIPSSIRPLEFGHVFHVRCTKVSKKMREGPISSVLPLDAVLVELSQRYLQEPDRGEGSKEEVRCLGYLHILMSVPETYRKMFDSWHGNRPGRKCSSG